MADAVVNGSIDGSDVGKHIVLSASHTGGRRYMIQNYHDAIAICRVYGPPDLFITFTCNPKGLRFPMLYILSQDSATLIELILLIGFTT